MRLIHLTVPPQKIGSRSAWHPQSAAYSNYVSGVSFCLDTNSSDEVVQLACSVTPKPSQVWTASNPTGLGTLQSESQCLTIDSLTSDVVVDTCVVPAPARQLWTLSTTSTTRNYQLKSNESGLCLERPDQTSGSQLITAACVGTFPLDQLFRTNHPPK